MIEGRLEAEIVIVGSGTAGATLAKELSQKGKQVILVEKGKREKRIGSMMDALRFYEGHSFRRSEEGMLMYGTSMVGGTSVVASGNALRCLQDEFMGLGIDLENYFKEAEAEIKPAPLPDKCIASGVMHMLETADSMGLNPQRIPKFIDPDKCRQCGNCVLGCKYGAKWSAVRYVNEAIKNNAFIFTQANVDRVISENGIAKAVEINSKQFGKTRIYAEKIILSAGGIGTPIILQKSGIENAGKKLFCDPFIVIYGAIRNMYQTTGVNTSFIINKQGVYNLLPFIDPALQFTLYTQGRSIIGRLGRNRTLGVMVKISDENIGRIKTSGKIYKKLTAHDKFKFSEGIDTAKKLLIKAGVDSNSMIIINKYRGAHLGGSASIGQVVSMDLETKIHNLFVCDNSIFMFSQGLPPIMTLIALSKWLSCRI